MYDIYNIGVGESLDTIASNYNINKELLQKLNPNSNFDIGDTIVIPTVNRYFEIYTIEKGDTLYEIARKYNTDYKLLALLNGLNTSDYIYPNTDIIVPKKDVKYYITKDNDTLLSVNNLLGANLANLLRINKNLYLKEGQLIVYSD